MDYQKEMLKRFKLQEEFGGINKEVNKIIPTVSVSVSTYNHEKYIEKCLDGILMQKTNFQFEILVGEDDSSDNTREICIKYALKYPNKIRLFLRDRKLSHLFNEKGILVKRLNGVLGFNRLANRGKYIALCEGDDYWTDPLKLQKQVDFLEKNLNYNICCGNIETYIQNESKIIKTQKFMGSFNFEEVVLKNHVTTLTVLYRNVKFPKEFINYLLTMPIGDYPLFLYLLKESKLYFFEEVFGVYRKHDGGVWNSKSKINALETKILYTKKALNFHKKHKFKYKPFYISLIRTYALLLKEENVLKPKIREYLKNIIKLLPYSNDISKKLLLKSIFKAI